MGDSSNFAWRPLTALTWMTSSALSGSPPTNVSRFLSVIKSDGGIPSIGTSRVQGSVSKGSDNSAAGRGAFAGGGAGGDDVEGGGAGAARSTRGAGDGVERAVRK